MKLKFLPITVMGFSIALLFLLPPFAEAFSYPDFKDIKSVTYYPFPYELSKKWGELNMAELEMFRNDISKMKINGINAVWLVLPWHQFESVALPEEQRQYDQAAFNNLKQVVSMLEEKNMAAILPLNYGGKGWIPGGVDWRAWLFNNQSWGAFYTYTARIAIELKDNPNVIFLFFSEGMGLESDEEKTFSRTDPDMSRIFRNWAYGINPNLSYWNQRWGLSYASWPEMLPQPPPGAGEVVNGNRYTDHARWVAYTVRNTLGTLDKVVKQWGNPNVKVGFHDWLLLATPLRFVNIDKSGESPIPDDNSFDAFSIVNYPHSEISTSSSYWISNLQHEISKVKAKHPGLPIFLGETGMDTTKWTEEQQQSIMTGILQEAKNQEVGFNIWGWKDSSLFGEGMGLLDINGNEKPIFQAIKPFITPADLNNDNKVDSADLGILMSYWNSVSKPKADLNQDGIVNSVDFGIMLSGWSL